MSVPVVEIVSSNAEQTRQFGRRLAQFLRAGDVVLLEGDLGAGKTTLVQGLGEGLGVRGRVTSPTYIVSRVHPSLVSGPDLVHVDAYRLEDDLDLETVDLASSIEESVTMIEWGVGKADSITDQHFEIRIGFPEADQAATTPSVDVEDTGSRVITFTARGATVQDRLAEHVQELREPLTVSDHGEGHR